MNDKMKNWSEGHGSYADMTEGVGIFTDDDSVSSRVVKRGVIPMANCNNCGRQWKGIVPWGEIAQFYIGQQVPETRSTRDGVVCTLHCRGCSKAFAMVITWPEIEQWVNLGVGSGALRPEIKKARQGQG
jgi:hypothetical protein